MHKNYLAAGAIFGGVAVALGAFGAHGLERVTSDEIVLHIYQTGVEYQMYHALALLAIGIIYERMPVKNLRWAANYFIAGILLFSGSLYVLTFLKIQGSSAVKFFGPVTPVGGIFLMLGWLFLLLAFTAKKNN